MGGLLVIVTQTESGLPGDEPKIDNPADATPTRLSSFGYGSSLMSSSDDTSKGLSDSEMLQ